MRPLSQRERSSSSQQPAFQTKMKSRVSGQSRADNLNLSVQAPNFNATQNSDFFPGSDVFNQTASKLSNSNFHHHDQQSCLCNICHCGRHLCKLHVIKPDLTKNTIYQRSFVEQKAIPNIVNHDKEYQKLQGPHLDMNSTQREGFQGRKGDKLERPKPEDLLHSVGPSQQLTSYSTQFPGHHGKNQYVKPTDKHTRGEFPLRSKSTYANVYVQKNPAKDDYTYIPDQLKTGQNWFGKSTYGEFFNNPNPEYFAKKVNVVEKLEDNPDYSRQYETVYKNDFIPKANPLCPAKVHLQTKGQGSFRDTKMKFAENSDFKALSPEFHAISTSKHSYV